MPAERTLTMEPKQESEHRKVFRILNEDVEKFLQTRPHPTDNSMQIILDPTNLSESDRRTLIRSIYAFIEGMSYLTRVDILSDFQDKLSTFESMAIREINYQVDGNGIVHESKAKIRTIALIKLTFNIATKNLDLGNQIECKGKGFESLSRCIKIRDRLMHPKSSKDLDVSDKEIKDAISAFTWFRDCLYKILLGTNKRLKAEIQAREEEQEKLEKEKESLKKQRDALANQLQEKLNKLASIKS
jgi:FtsZ-binding cell division protein ZapB